MPWNSNGGNSNFMPWNSNGGNSNFMPWNNNSNNNNGFNFNRWNIPWGNNAPSTYPKVPYGYQFAPVAPVIAIPVDKPASSIK
jgi:hypothetical protein